MAPTNTIGLRVDEYLATALAAERPGRARPSATSSGGPLRRAYAVDRSVYGIGAQHSLVGDCWDVSTRGSAADEAVARLGVFRAGIADGTALAAFGLTTSNTSAIVPPGYQPLAAEPDADRPLWGLTMQLPLASPTPFGVPDTVTTSGATAANVEGTNPSAGSVSFTGGTVTPVARSGVYDVSRELLDSASPAVDAIVLNAMVEDYAEKLEQLVATELTTLDPAATTSATNLVRDVKRKVARMPGTRRRRAAGAVVSAADALADAAADGFDELSGDVMGKWRVQGCRVNLSADLGDSSGEVVAAVVAPASLWSWATGPRKFHHEQTYGPAPIRLSVFGYAAVKTIRASGVRTLELS